MKRSNAPAMPWVLGLAGLVPFCGLAAGAWLAPPPYDAVSLSGFYVYAAVILSFLGGTRWGFELAARSEHPSGITLILSNLPALMGWFGVMLQLVQPVAGLVVLTVGLVLVWLWDVQSSGPGQRRLPDWYPPLRTALTVVVLACCAAIGWQISS